VALSASAAARRAAAPAVQQSIDISYLPDSQQQTRPHADAAGEWDRQTDGWTDTVPLCRHRSAYYAASANKASFILQELN